MSFENTEKLPSTTPQKTLSAKERMQKLRELKNLKKDSKVENKRELYKEYETKRTNLKVLKALASKQEDAQEELNKLELESKGINYERLKNLNYTVQDDEAWNNKLASEKTENDQREFQNYKQLAERTYLKKLKDLKKSKLTDEDYQAQKRVYEHLKSQGDTEDQIITKLTDKKKLNELINGLKEKDAKSYKKRKITTSGDDSGIGFINDKNKQFNDKLDRHYNKFLSDLKDDIERGSST